MQKKDCLKGLPFLLEEQIAKKNVGAGEICCLT